MSRRLYLMCPDEQSCKALVRDLERHGVSEKHLHVVGSLTRSLEGLPEAGVLQKTELINGLIWGLGLGRERLPFQLLVSCRKLKS